MDAKNAITYTANDAVRMALRSAGKNQNDLAEHLNKSKQAVSAQLRRKKDLNFGVFQEIMDWLGYEIDVAPKGSQFVMIPNGVDREAVENYINELKNKK